MKFLNFFLNNPLFLSLLSGQSRCIFELSNGANEFEGGSKKIGPGQLKSRLSQKPIITNVDHPPGEDNHDPKNNRFLASFWQGTYSKKQAGY